MSLPTARSASRGSDRQSGVGGSIATVDLDVVVVGAGITGLACAHALRQAGLQLLVLEQGPRAGGCIETIEKEGFLLEAGPHTLRATGSDLLDHLEEIGLGEHIVPSGPAGSTRSIVRDGRVVSLPRSPLGFLTSRFLSPSGKVRLLGEPWVEKPADPDPSLADFVGHRFGREVRDGPLDAFVGGIWAGDPSRISARAAFPELVEGVDEHGSLFRWAMARRRARRADPPSAGPNGSPGSKSRAGLGIFSLKGGLSVWTDQLAGTLGRALQLGARVLDLEPDGDGWSVTWSRDGEVGSARARHVVLTGGPAATAALARGAIPKSLVERLERVRSASLAVVHLGYDRDSVDEPPEGFGVLIPQAERRSCLGILFVSSFLPGRAPEGALTTTAFLGGIRAPELLELDDEELVRRVHQEHQELLGFRRRPTFAHVRRWSGAIPQYEHGHDELLAELTRVDADHPSLHLAGRYRGGVSVPDCWRRGSACAHRVASALRSGASA